MVASGKQPRERSKNTHSIIRVSLEELEVSIIQVLPAVRTLGWGCLQIRQTRKNLPKKAAQAHVYMHVTNKRFGRTSCFALEYKCRRYRLMG